MSVFDKRASEWDEKPRRVKLAKDIVLSIIKYAEPEKDIEIADFGTGTGLVLLGLADYATEMTGYDSSEGMLEVLRMKAAQADMVNLATVKFDIETDQFPKEAYDLITCSMVAHHLENPEKLFSKAYDALRIGSKLCVADLVKTDIPFHEEPQEGVAHDDGFETEWIEKSLKKSGFEKIEIYQAAVIEKERDGEILKFPVFLAVAEK